MLPDITSLLVPISSESPAGTNLEYEILFNEIRRARESDPDYLPQGEWSVSVPRKADWHLVRTLSEKALIEQSKDLQLACWFVEALCHQHGLIGLLNGIEFLSEFITRFWFHCWPSLEEGLSSRRSRLLRLDRDLSQQLFCQPLLRQENTSLACWRQILAFEHKINTAPEARDDLIHEVGDLTMATFDQQAVHFPSIEISRQAERVAQLMVSFLQLETRYASLSQDPEGELFALIRQVLVDLADYLQRLSQRTIPLADETIDLNLLMENDDMSQPTHAPVLFSPQAMNRELAVSQMLAIAGYFRQNEPSSPVPFLMERAARWANMTLTEWLEEMLNDSSINDINHVLTGQSR